MTKYPTSVLLTPEAKALLAALAEQLGCPKTAIYEMAIRLFAKEHKCEVPVEATNPTPEKDSS